MTYAHIINTLIYIVPCFVLLFVTFKDFIKTFILAKVTLAILAFLFITFYGSNSYSRYDEFPPKFILLALITMVLGAVIFCLVTQYHFRHCIFIVAIAKCYSDHVIFLGMYSHFLIYGHLPSFQSFEALIATLIILAATFPLVCRFFTTTLRKALDYSYHFPIWRMMWIIPVCNNMLYNFLFSPNVSNYELPPDFSFYYVPPIWVILTVATYIIVLSMAIVTSENAKLTEKLHISETICLSQQKQSETLQTQIEQTSRMRHDIRHHLVVMEAYIKTNDLSGLSEYIKTYRSAIPSPSAIYCDSLTINSLIGHYKELANQNKTQMDISVSLPKSPDFPDIDLCSVLANLLENAVEACARMKFGNRFIDLKVSAQSSSVLAILVKNSYEGEIIHSAERFASSKGNDRKGIGISSVQNIVEQYNGIAKFEYQNHIFKASVLLKIQ